MMMMMMTMVTILAPLSERSNLQAALAAWTSVDDVS